MENMILVGFGGHAKSVIDSIESSKCFHIIGFTDVKPMPSYNGYNYLGNDEILQDYFNRGVRNAFITIGYLGKGNTREQLYKTLKKIGYNIPVVKDHTAVVARNVKIGEGTLIGKNVVLNADSNIGKMCIINTGAVIEHGNSIGDFTHIAVNSTLCGDVCIGKGCLVGANATVIQNRKVGEYCIIGAGSTVLRNIRSREIVCGIVNDHVHRE